MTVPADGEQIVEPDWQGSAEVSGWAGLVYTNGGLKIQGTLLWHNSADPAEKYTEAAGPVVNQSGSGCIIPIPGAPRRRCRSMKRKTVFPDMPFANTTNGPVALNLAIYDQSGQQIAQYSKQIAAFGHESFLLHDRLPDLAGKKGIVVITGDGIAPLGLRFTPYYTFMRLQP